MTITCSFCTTQAVSGVDDVNGGEYYAVCSSDLARLVADFGMVAVELITEFDPCECGCDY